MSRHPSGRSRCSTCGRDRCPGASAPRSSTDSGAAAPGISPAAMPLTTPARSRRCCPGKSAVRTATACCSVPRSRSSCTAQPRIPSRASPAPPPPLTQAPRGECSRLCAEADLEPQLSRRHGRGQPRAGAGGEARPFGGRTRARGAEHPGAAPLRLDPSGFDLIAELKLRSPTAGRLGAPDESVAARVTAYARAGSAAVSVLTEPSRFDGTLDDLASAARLLAPLAVPAMRKDFLVDPYQVLEARAAGAGGVLAIVRMLSRGELDALLDCARALGLFVLLEAFDARDLELVRDLVASHTGPHPLLTGVNCRDLGTLEVMPRRLLELSPLLPPGTPCVAESGVTSPADVREIAAAGYRLALIGSALMRGGDPGTLARTFLAAGRAVREAV